LSRSLVQSAERGASRAAVVGRTLAAIGLLVLCLVASSAFAASAGASAAPSATPSASPTLEVPAEVAGDPGAAIFAANCSGCHGPLGRGGPELIGPSLAAAGSASLVAAMVQQGGIRMPSFAEQLPESSIQTVARFVAERLSDPAARTADAATGGQLYRLYCAGCHSTTGRGGALTRGPNAPNIAQYPAAEALAAMILGRGNMPVFAGNTLDVGQQAAVGRYVQVLVDPPSPGGNGLGFLGPVPEGAAGAVGMLILIFVAVWLAWPTRKAVP
jgi:quinol---cytochrome-c reductase cytochrome c subunit